MTNVHRAGGVFTCALWIALASLSGLVACGSGSEQAPRAVESDSDSVEPESSPAVDQPPVLDEGPVACDINDAINETHSSEIVLLAGQSNANTGLAAAMRKSLSAQDLNYFFGHHYVGGRPINSWMLEDGTPGPIWAPMMRAFDTVINQSIRSEDNISALTFVWFQGEADVYPAQYPLYKPRLGQLIQAIQAHAEVNWPNVPAPAFSIAMPENILPRFRAPMDSIRESIKTTADETANVCAFDTKDIRRVDAVHIVNIPGIGSQEQLAVAQRALACGRAAANRCEKPVGEQ
ncbi:MAG: sialate O-acetylesterase [Burkholderiaceae bacterium]